MAFYLGIDGGGSKTAAPDAVNVAIVLALLLNTVTFFVSASTVFLSRKEYDELVAKAVSKPDVKAPHSAAVLAATYDGKLEDGRAVIQGTLQIEVLNDGIQAIAKFR